MGLGHVSPSHLCLYVLYLALSQHQHSEGPEASEGSGSDLRQVVSSQLQEPGGVREAPGNQVKAPRPAVHQVRVIIADTQVRTGRGGVNREEEEEEEEEETHGSSER